LCCLKENRLEKKLTKNVKKYLVFILIFKCKIIFLKREAFGTEKPFPVSSAGSTPAASEEMILIYTFINIQKVLKNYIKILISRTRHRYQWPSSGSIVR